MTKKHKKRGRARFPWESRKAPSPGGLPAGRVFAQNLMHNGPHYTEKNFVRIMRGSHILRAETEFCDLVFDRHRTVDVSARVLEKYQRQMRKSTGEDQDILRDNMRAEIIDELATPDFRKDVLHRLEVVADRLMNTMAADRFEMALVLKLFLEAKEVSWGLCGLMTTIYAESLQRAEVLEREDEEIFGEFRQAHEKGGNEEIFAMMKDAQQTAKLVRKIEANPGLNERLQQEATEALGVFEHKLERGELELDLFTEAELIKAGKYFEQYLAANKIVDVAKADPQRMAEVFVKSMQQTIRDIMVPERAEKMKACLQEISRIWLDAGNPLGAMLQVELAALDGEYANNPFLFAGFVGQLKRIQKRMKG